MEQHAAMWLLAGLGGGFLAGIVVTCVIMAGALAALGRQNRRLVKDRQVLIDDLKGRGEMVNYLLPVCDLLRQRAELAEREVYALRGGP